MGTDVEVREEQRGGQLDVYAIEKRRLNALYGECETLSKSKFCPEAYKDDANTVFALARYGEQYGLSPVHAVSRLYVINGKIEPSADVLIALAIAHGHEVRYDETSSERCTVSIRRDGTDYWQSLTWTINDARRAGLLDLWVVRWVQAEGSNKKYPEEFKVGHVDTGVEDELVREAPDWVTKELQKGRLRSKENWAKYPDDMLAAKAIRRAVKRFCPDVLLRLADEGAGMSVDRLADRDQVVLAGDRHDEEPEPGEPDDDDDEDIVDAELVDDQVDDVAADDAAPVDDDEPAVDVVDLGPPPTDPGKIYLPPTDAEPTDAEPAKPAPSTDEPLAGATFTRSFAIHVREADMHDGRKLDDEDRHALVAYATAGRTRSVKDVFASEVSDCFTALKQLERGHLVLVDVDGVRQVQEAAPSDD